MAWEIRTGPDKITPFPEKGQKTKVEAEFDIYEGKDLRFEGLKAYGIPTDIEKAMVTMAEIKIKEYLETKKWPDPWIIKLVI